MSLGPGMEVEIKRSIVLSESIASVGYHPSAQTLEVEFVGGAIYRYGSVSQALADMVMDGPVSHPPEYDQRLMLNGVDCGNWAVGRFFAFAIRSQPERFPHERIER